MASLIFLENSLLTFHAKHHFFFVQSIISFISLTSSLMVKMLTVLVSTISCSQVFLLKKMWVAFANAKATHMFSAKILVYNYAIFNICFRMSSAVILIGTSKVRWDFLSDSSNYMIISDSFFHTIWQVIFVHMMHRYECKEKYNFF